MESAVSVRAGDNDIELQCDRVESTILNEFASSTMIANQDVCHSVPLGDATVQRVHDTHARVNITTRLSTARGAIQLILTNRCCISHTAAEAALRQSIARKLNDIADEKGFLRDMRDFPMGSPRINRINVSEKTTLTRP